MLDPHFVILAACFNTVGYSSYAWATLRGRARPNRASWFCWALAPLIAFAAQVSSGVGLSSLMTFMVGFGPVIVIAASFVGRHAAWKITRFDVVCTVVSLLGVVLWALTRHGVVAIALSIAADLVASVPTIRKAYTNPETESPVAFGAAAVSAVLTSLTITTWTFSKGSFPVYILAVNLLMCVLAARPARTVARP